MIVHLGKDVREKHAAAEFPPGGAPRHRARVDEPPKRLPGAAAVKNVNGSEPLVKEAGGSNPKGSSVGGDGAAPWRRANGLPDGDVLHGINVQRP